MILCCQHTFNMIVAPYAPVQTEALYVIQVRVKKFVPNKKGDIGMEVHYLYQPNTYVIAREFGEQQ